MRLQRTRLGGRKGHHSSKVHTTLAARARLCSWKKVQISIIVNYSNRAIWERSEAENQGELKSVEICLIDYIQMVRRTSVGSTSALDF